MALSRRQLQRRKITRFPVRIGIYTVAVVATLSRPAQCDNRWAERVTLGKSVNNDLTKSVRRRWISSFCANPQTVTQTTSAFSPRNGAQDVRRQADQFPSRRKWRILLHRVRGEYIFTPNSTFRRFYLVRLFITLFQFYLFFIYFRWATTCACSADRCTNGIRACSGGPSPTTRGNV